MKGRNIAENIRILYDSIYCTKKATQHRILLILKKHLTLYNGILSFNFDKKFIKWIRFLYNDTCS